MQKLATLLLVLVGLLNLLPASGAVSADRLEALYGLRFAEPNLLILMHHRAILFGILGGLLVASARYASLRPVAITVNLVSMLSFVLVALVVGGVNAELQRVALADVVGSVALVGALLLARVGAGRQGES